MVITLDGIEGSGELWLDIMRIICGDTSRIDYCETMVDLGAHRSPYTPLLGFSKRVYVDIQARPLDHPNEQQYFVQDDIIHYLEGMQRGPTTFILSDVIEHLTLKDGYMVIELMVHKGYKNIIFTPLGEYMMESVPTTNPDAHRSAWIPEMISGYTSIVFPNFHKALGKGAFFAFNCEPSETERIVNEITNKYVI